MINKSVHNDDNWGDDYSSSLVKELADAITPQEQEQTDYKMKLAAKIYMAMKAHGMTQTQFANSIDKPISLISRWMSGTHNFTVETLVDIQRILGISLLNLETANSYSQINFKLNISSTITDWTPYELNQYVSDMGGLAVSEKTIEYVIED
ncbi:Helix-turn-helix [Chitinophaga eiseniae]|uniref:Helix-turn-helix n=1 Tax=Chitinophaga eiseniae TaxID=634771 RepID=A0A1T4KN79_9BACT|nr:helix-turn-helix transcriptional regulator [Chitinophaga eiseniae]SJZ43823.1 Helix-turn-helix [Chitinophaga eiseniae]